MTYTYENGATTKVDGGFLRDTNYALVTSGAAGISVTSYGAVGDGVTDDSAAFQAAFTAAIAAKATLIIPAPSSYYKLVTTISLAPPGSDAFFYLNIQGPAAVDAIQWAGANSTAVFSSIGWKRSTITSVNIKFANTNTGGVGWDIDGAAASQSSAQLNFVGCTVSTATASGMVGWRIGHATTGVDFSFINWFGCHFSASAVTGTSVGWLNEGSNALNNSWYGCSALYAAKGWSNVSGAGAVSAIGNAAMFLYGCGSSHCDKDFDLGVTGSYLISGFRGEVGKRFLDLNGSGSTVAPREVTVEGSILGNYAPSDNIVISSGAAAQVTFRGNQVTKDSGAYTAAFFTLSTSGTAGYGSLVIDQCDMNIADPCYTISAGRWKVSVLPGNTVIDTSKNTTGFLTARRPDVIKVTAPTGSTCETFSRSVGLAANQTPLISAQLWLCLAEQKLRGGEPVSNITIVNGSGSSATMNTPLNQWFSLVDASTRSVLAKTMDDTTTAWALSTPKSLFVMRTVTDAAISSTVATTTLTSATAAFTSSDTGRQVTVIGAGAAGAPLGTSAVPVTMTYVNATTVTVSVAASTTVTGAVAYIATPYTPAEDTAVYFGVLVKATTCPDLRGNSMPNLTADIVPQISGESTSGLTNPASLGATAAALTATASAGGAARVYGYTS